MTSFPKVAILLAAYNAKKWLWPQLETLFSQESCILTVYISLDESSDGSEEWLAELASQYESITVLPIGERFGSAAKNFYRLIRDVNLDSYDYVAFCDQDDLWKLDKIKSAISLLNRCKGCGYSSNVTAYWSDVETKRIKKDYPQTNLDYFFESAGPGCTYIFPIIEFLPFQILIRKAGKSVNKIDFHDWLIYAYIRLQDKRWIIDSYESMFYRQHSSNVIGARSGLSALKSRLNQIRNGWYRKQICLICEVLEVTDNEIYRLISRNRMIDRLALLKYGLKLRRKRSDALILAILILFNQW